MASLHKRPSRPVNAITSIDSSGIKMEGSCEPPCKKLCQSPRGDIHPDSQPTGGSSSTLRESAVTLTGGEAHRVCDQSDDSDEFETLEQLVAASQNCQATSAPETEAPNQLSPVPSADIDLDGTKVEATQHGHTISAAAGDGLITQAVSAYTEADLELPRTDAGEESDDSMIIDLTRDDAELQIGRSDGFIGVIKPGAPGITVKREGSIRATPTRRVLTPLSTNTRSPNRLGNRKSMQPGMKNMMPDAHSGPVPSQSIKSEDAEYIMSPSMDAPSRLKREDPATPAQVYKSGLVKMEHQDRKPSRCKRAADGSPKSTSLPNSDMTFLVNKQNLASMPCAAQLPQLKTKLLKHQRQALQWMIDMERPHSPRFGPSARLTRFWGAKPPRDDDADTAALPSETVVPFSGGILADDMGLGKTLEMIALILTEPKSGPSLIIAPKGVLTNWESQIRRHISWQHAPRVFRYHGSRSNVTPSEVERNDIVITTYNKVADEAYGDGTLRQVRWRRIILDEGHTIRNPDSMAALASCKLRAKSRWVCTGTPIINSVNDIYSLSKFIGITATIRKSPQEIIRRLKNDHQFLQDIMTTVCLRRTKEMSFVNLELPPKQEKLIRIEFSEAEDKMYQKLLVDANKAAQMFFKMRHYDLWTHLLERLLRLRQMCNHWSLCKKKGMDNCRKELHGLLHAVDGAPNESQLGEILQLSLEAKIACGFCGEPVDFECSPVICPCAHVYCKACIIMPLQETLTCPMCKERFGVSGIIEMGSVPKSALEVPGGHDHSTKTKALISLVKQRLQNKGSKIVIFSQWTSFLDIVAHHLEDEGIEHVRIDGTMSTGLRDEAAKVLDKDPNVRVMLASLRAAGVGINLVAADTAILADSWWAPAIEEQAVDRVHRLGQTRTTKVYRLVVKGAVEEGVVRIQDRKRELVGTAFQEKFKALSDVSFSNMVKEMLGWEG